MADRIKGITVQIGGDTTGLNKALSGVNKEIRNTQQNLKDVERLLKLDPENVELLRQKQQLLSNQIADTTNKLDSLKEAEKQVQEQFEKGEVSQDQYFALRREIIDTESRLKQLADEAEKTENAIKDIDEKPLEEVAAAADEAEEQLEQAGKEASNFKDYLKAEAIVEGAKGIVSGLKDVAEESKEYMKIMGSLEVSSEKAGYSAEETAETYKTLYGVLADDQTAATTTANLQALQMEQDKLNLLTTATIGAWATYGDSIPIDGLAEAINETAQVGQVTGTLADVLNWAGVSEDEFNAKLAEIGDSAGRADLILQQLTEQGLAEAGEAWQKNNEALVENNQANAELQEQMALLGETVMPVFTQITELVAGLLEKFNGLDEGQQKTILTIIALVATLGPVISTIGNLAGGVGGLSKLFGTVSNTVLPALQTAFTSVFSFIAANPIVLLIAAIVGLVALIATKGDEIQALLQKVDDFLQDIFAKDWTEVFGPVLGGQLNTFFATVKDIWDAIKKIFDGVIDFIRGVFTGDWERAWKGVTEIFGGIFDGLIALAKAPINGIIGLLNMGIDAVNTLIEGFNSIGFDLPDWLGGGSWHPSIPTIPNIPFLAEGGTVVNSGTVMVGENGPELLELPAGARVVPLSNSDMSGIDYDEMTKCLVDALRIVIPDLKQTEQIIPGAYGGDIVMPIYLGNEILDEIVVNSRNRVALRSGGMVSV